MGYAIFILILVYILYNYKSISNAANSAIGSGINNQLYPFASTITPQQAVIQAWNLAPNPNPNDRNAQVSSPDSYNAVINGNWLSLDYQYYARNGTCSGETAQNNSGLRNLSLIKQGDQLALTTLNATGRIGGVIGSAGIAAAATAGLSAITFGIGSIIGIFAQIVAHHAKAVALEHQIACTLIPAADNYFQIIRQGVDENLITLQDAIRALESLGNDFKAKAEQGPPFSSPYCNALCESWVHLKAMILYWQSGYQSMIDGPVTAVLNSDAAQSIRTNYPIGGSF